MLRRKLLLATTAIGFVSSINIIPLSASPQDEIIEEVIVTGTHIKRKNQFNSPSPISVIGSENIEALGAKNMADVIQTLTINNGSQNNPDAFTQNGTTGTSNFNLRGLGVGSTLVLLNGKRQVNSASVTNGGHNFVDTSSLIPTIAIERIEILKDGAAATYGSDAVAGVFNFITNNQFEGFKFSGDFQKVADQGTQKDVLLQGMAGWNFDTTHIMAAFSYYDRTSLTTEERRLSNPSDDTSLLGNPGAFYTAFLPAPLIPGGIIPLPGPLPFIDPTGCSPAGGIPIALGAPINTGSATFTPGLCGFDFGDYYHLVPKEERVQAFTSITQGLGDKTTLRLEGAFSNNKTRRGNSPSFPILTLPALLGNHPENVFGIPVAFFGRAIGNGGAVEEGINNSNTYRMSATIEGETEDGLNWEISATQARNDYEIIISDTVSDRFQMALFGYGGEACTPFVDLPGTGNCHYYNPFSTSYTTAPNSPQVMDYLFEDQVQDIQSKLLVAETIVSKEFGESSIGNTAIAFGLQYRKETLTNDYDDISNADGFAFLIGNSDYGDTRQSIVAFTEAAISVSQDLEIQLAARYESYNKALGFSVDPKIAVLYQYSPELTFRASFGTSYRAPSIFQAFGASTSLQQVLDPITGGQFFAAVRSTKNEDGARDLKPEQSENYNLGFSWQPEGGFRFDLDYWKYDFSDVIIEENFQAILNDSPQDPNRVIRAGDPLTGPVLRINTNFVNASNVNTDGIDLRLSYRAEMENGAFIPTFEASYVLNYDLDDPQAGAIEGSGNRNFTNFGNPTPKLRYNAGFQWVYGRHQFGASYRFISKLTDDQNGEIEIPSMGTFDAQYKIDVSNIVNTNGETSLAFGVINAFGKTPPHVATNGGFESRTHDPRGRLIYARVVAGF